MMGYRESEMKPRCAQKHGNSAVDRFRRFRIRMVTCWVNQARACSRGWNNPAKAGRTPTDGRPLATVKHGVNYIDVNIVDGV